MSKRAASKSNQSPLSFSSEQKKRCDANATASANATVAVAVAVEQQPKPQWIWKKVKVQNAGSVAMVGLKSAHARAVPGEVVSLVRDPDNVSVKEEVASDAMPRVFMCAH